MMDDTYDARRATTFAQAEGVEALPQQYETQSVSAATRARLWAIFYQELSDHYRYVSRVGFRFFGIWESVTKNWWVERKNRALDDFPEPKQFIALAKNIIMSGSYVPVYDFVQFVVRAHDDSGSLKKAISHVLVTTYAPYRLIDDTIVPLTSPEQASAIMAAIAVVAKSGVQGPRTHLRQAGEALTAGDWSSAVRESIHAVEGAAKSIEPTAATLGPALSKLESSIGLNSALKKAFSALYGYTSDAEGVRHALVLGATANVDERDAMFMFGACASFVGYLLSASSA